jgi:mannose-6-phosphate isomerase-like protein (cupin superfamily)
MSRVIDNVEAFRAERAWGALDLAEIGGASVALHWTDQPYRWHRNQGAEVFVVLAGEVDMHTRRDGRETVVRLRPTDIYVAEEGDAHKAVPIGEARVLVIEQQGSP